MATEKISEIADSEDEVETLKLQNETLKHELKDRDTVILRLEQERAALDSEITALKQAMEDAEGRINEVNEDRGHGRGDRRGFNEGTGTHRESAAGNGSGSLEDEDSRGRAAADTDGPFGAVCPRENPVCHRRLPVAMFLR